MNIKVVLEKSEDGKYFVYVPSLPGVVADGNTRDEALSGLKRELAAYLEPSEEDLPSNRNLLSEIEV
ncbi:MAG: type II toxin-antitoxin system HicB family antitoxin [Candidatus Hydrogenedentota bacterium]|nr:MAG: type II toxin-antitoxin system HicB family antitoxin [Candidatus Hydrogenedentota bacterium]